MLQLIGMTIPRARLILLAFLPGLPQLALADAPTITSVWPPGAVRGTSTRLQIEGTGLAGCRLFASGAGLIFGKPEPLPGDHGTAVTLTVAGGASVGPHEVRAVGSSGSTGPAIVWVSVFPQSTEIEPNDDTDRAEKVRATTATVYGRVDHAGDRDCFAFDAIAGETWVAACVAKGFRSPLDAVIDVVDSAGAIVSRAEAVRGADPRLVVSIPRDGRYTVTVSDAQGHGGPECAYLLTVGKPPVIQEFTPHAERPGRTVGLIVRGANLGGTTRARVSVPADADEAVWFSVRTASGPSVPFLFPLSEEPAIAVTESDQTMAFPGVPSALEGKLEAYNTARYFVDLGANEHLQFTLLTRSIGSRLDAQLEVLGSDARVIATSPAGGVLSLPAHDKGRYVVQVRSRGAVGSDCYYRLEARREKPGFRATAPRSALTIAAGSSEKIPIVLTREGGFAGDVDIVAGSLPRGVTLSGGHIPAGVQQKDVVLTVARTASREPFLLRLRARARVGGRVVDRMVRPTETENGGIRTLELLPAVVLPPSSPAPSRESERSGNSAHP